MAFATSAIGADTAAMPRSALIGAICHVAIRWIDCLAFGLSRAILGMFGNWTELISSFELADFRVRSAFDRA
jgi:hypothetical protein